MIPQVTPEEADAILRRHADTVYLDVRTEDEFVAGHPAGAYNVPVVFFDAQHRATANKDFERVVSARFARDAKILVGCQSGVRSQRAAEMMRALGFTDVSNVAGGFGGSPAARGWRDSGLAVERGGSADRGYPTLQKT